MTTAERSEINKQNAQHSTGPKTDEGKAKSAQNAVTHGLTSAIPPLQNPKFLQFLNGFLEERNPQSPTQYQWVEEMAHIAWKLKQIPSLEQEVEQTSGLTLSEHFAQEKPTPLVKLWNLQLRLQGRFNSLDRKLTQNGCPIVPPVSSPANPPNPANPSAPNSPVQNEPTLDDLLRESENLLLQNEPTQLLKSLNKLTSAVNSVPIPIPNPF